MDSVAVITRSAVNSFTYEIDGTTTLLFREGSWLVPESRTRGYADIQHINVSADSMMQAIFTDKERAVFALRQSETRWTLPVPKPPKPSIGALSNLTVLTGKTASQPFSYTAFGKNPKVSVSSQRTVSLGASSLVVSGNRFGKDTVTITVTDQWGQSASRSFTVTQPTVPTLAAIGGRSGNVGTSQTFTLSSKVYTGSGTWYTLKTSSSNVTASVSGHKVTVNFKKVGKATITVTVRDSWGQTTSRSFIATAKPKPVSWMHPLGNSWPKGRWTTYGGEPSHAAGALDFGTGYGGQPPVYAPCNGTVIWAGPWGTYAAGTVTIRPDGENVGIALLHLNRVDVGNGARVTTGQRVGLAGWTGYTVPAGPGGAHLHVEVRTNGNQWGPWLRALDYFKAKGVTL